jgi:hypothetical protein
MLADVVETFFRPQDLRNRHVVILRPAGRRRCAGNAGGERLRASQCESTVRSSAPFGCSFESHRPACWGTPQKPPSRIRRCQARTCPSASSKRAGSVRCPRLGSFR